MDIVKWGIIGPGNIANSFADGLKESKSGELVAIGSTNEGRRKSFGDKYNIKSNLRFETYDEILDISYDSLETWEERTIAAWKQIEKILTLPKDEFCGIFEEVQDKVIYNQQRFFNYDGYTEDFVSELVRISNATK